MTIMVYSIYPIMGNAGVISTVRPSNNKSILYRNPRTLNPKPPKALYNSPIICQGVVLCTLGVCNLGCGSLNHGIWPLMTYLGPKTWGMSHLNPTLRVLRLLGTSRCRGSETPKELSLGDSGPSEKEIPDP